MATLASRIHPSSNISLKNILFATDFSEPSMKALPYASALATKFGATVFPCHVITPSSLIAAAPQVAPELYAAEQEAATNDLNDILGSAKLKGLKAQARLTSGILGDAVLEEIRQNNIDLIIAGTHGRTGFRRFLLGSGVEQICRVATCPVLTVGPECPRTGADFKHILIPTDLSEDSMRALPFVVHLAEAYGAGVTVLHVLPEETASNPDTKQLSEPVKTTMVRIFGPPLSTLKVDFMIEAGKTAETILQVAQEKNADLIAMGIRNAFLPGFQPRMSVAYRVMTGSHCPVLTCR
jgi:nucleotide-binding universal stress UspA family protein